MKTETLEERRERAMRIIEILRREYPDAKCSLDFSSPHQLLVAAILAAQCTDVRVNMVTPELFQKYPNVEAFANADYAELEGMVKSTGFFRNKTNAIIGSSREIVSDFGDEVPQTVDELLTLSGVGRKTANLILGVAYGKPAIIVDTHVKRITKRLGLTENEDPTKIEFDLDKILPQEEWTHFNHVIIFHGRAVCKAPMPVCAVCAVVSLCPFGLERMAGKSDTSNK